MADLKTTAEERAKLKRLARVHAEKMHQVDALNILDDLDTLLAENARLRAEVAYLADGRPLDAIRRTAAEMVKLRAVAEAAREYRALGALNIGIQRDLARDDLDAALAALEAP